MVAVTTVSDGTTTAEKKTTSWLLLYLTIAMLCSSLKLRDVKFTASRVLCTCALKSKNTCFYVYVELACIAFGKFQQVYSLELCLPFSGGRGCSAD